MEKLHPGARALFRIRGYFSMVFIAFFLSWFLVPALAVILTLNGSSISGITVLVLIIVCIFLVVCVTEIYVKFAYKNWAYEFTPNGLKLERGIVWKKYSNIPYERVQNIDVHRGILARMLGFSTVDIQTAGLHFSGRRGGMPRSEGHLPAVSVKKAEEIRELIMKKISRKGGL